MSKVINFGSLNIDYVYNVPHIVHPGETLLSDGYQRYCGGKGLNQSLALSKYGIEVYHAGSIGKDGIFLKEKLNKAGINTKNIIIGDKPTGHAIIQVTDDGENSIVLYPGANRTITLEQIEIALEDVESKDILLLQNEINNNALIIEKAFAKNMIICLNPAPFDDSIAALPLDKVNIIVLNEIESMGLSGEKNEDKAIKTLSERYPAMTIIITLGRRGVLCVNKGRRIFLPAHKVDVLDTTAAGDTFIGYFLGAILSDIPIEDALRFGVIAASITITRRGAADSIPEKNEVKLLYENVY